MILFKFLTEKRRNPFQVKQKSHSWDHTSGSSTQGIALYTAFCLSSLTCQVDLLMQKEGEQVLQNPPPLHTLTLFTVLYCSILSKQAVQDLGAWRREEGYSEHPRNNHKAGHWTPLIPKHWGTGVQNPGWGLSIITCSVCPFWGTNAGGDLSGFPYRNVIKLKEEFKSLFRGRPGPPGSLNQLLPSLSLGLRKQPSHLLHYRNKSSKD